uniref:Nudix (Nucleoside diphosphate linked moiety X)-type motif 17 n=1 Tax=Nothobranchius korthausae TaxID=1143690 RepID=A0A1A8GBC3_9TELE
MNKVRRILVYVWRDRAAPQQAPFLQSVTGFFTDGGDDEVEVNCLLEKNQFILSEGDRGQRIRLKRPSFCPIKHLSASESAAIPLDVEQRGVDVGVAVLLQTVNQRVLLTQRAKHLRIFPNLLAAGLRELKEETGLKLKPKEVSPKILGLWESAFPAMLSRGLPQRHHIVVYMLLLSPLSHLHLQVSLKPSPAEVASCVWADSHLAKAIVSSVDGEEGEASVDGLPSSISVSHVSEDGGLTDSLLPLEILTNRVPFSGLDVERVSTGTKYALDLWLKSLDTCSDP